MQHVFEWTTESLKYDMARHRCTFLGLFVGRIVAVAGEPKLRCESSVVFVQPFYSTDLALAKAQLEAEATKWFEAAVTACGDEGKPYRAEDHPDLFPARANDTPAPTS